MGAGPRLGSSAAATLPPGAPTEALAGGESAVSVLEHCQVTVAGFDTHHQIMMAAWLSAYALTIIYLQTVLLLYAICLARK